MDTSGINEIESEAIQNLLYIAVVSRPVASLSSPCQDGIDDVEAGAFRWLNNMRSADVASSVISLSWIQDGVDDNSAYEHPKVASSVVALGWVQDGIEDVEVETIYLSYIAYEDAEVASLVISLGWVRDSIEDAEIALIKSLASIQGIRRRHCRLRACRSWRPLSRPI